MTVKIDKTSFTIYGRRAVEGGGGAWRLNQTVNISNYNYLKIELFYNSASSPKYDETYSVGIYQSSGITTYTQLTARTDLYGISGEVTQIVNISSLSGNYFIYMCPHSGNVVASMQIYKILLSTT